MAFGGKVGEAWVEIHARGSKHPTDLKKIAERDAKAYADSFMDEIESQSEDRIRRSRRNMAGAFVDRDFEALIKMFGDADKAIKGTEQTLAEWQKRGQLTENQHRMLTRQLKDMAEEYRRNEMELERLAEAEKKRITETKERQYALSQDLKRQVQEQREIERRQLEERKAQQRLGAEMARDRERQLEAEEKRLKALGTALDDLGKKREKMEIESIAGILLGEEDWKSLQRRFGGLDQAQERLLGRMQEMRAEGRMTDQQYDDSAAALRRFRDEHEESSRGIVKSLQQIGEERKRLRRDAIDNNLADLIFDKDSADQVAQRLRNSGASVRELQDRMRHLARQGEISGRTYRRVWRSVITETRRDIREHGESIGRVGSVLNRLGRRYDSFSTAWRRNTARAFGRGSRNNFLNFTGALTGLTVSLFAFPIKILSSLATGIANTFAKVGQLQQTGMGLLPALLSAIAPLALSTGAALVALAIAASAVAVIVPVMISAISMLVGALTVLVGVLTVGVLGALVTLLPLLGALVVGLGGVGLVVKAFADNWDDAKVALGGFIDVFNDLVKRAEPIMDRVIRQVGRLEDEFAGLGNVALLAVDGLVDGFERFIDRLESPAMAQFLTQWGESIPKIVTSLGNAMADFSAGLIAYLAPILPYAERLASAIERGAERFFEWSTSTRGQNSIASWMEVAWDAASSLWNTLVNIGDILFTIFTSATEGAGNGFLSWLERVTEEWGAFLKTDEGQAQMKAFWEDVSEFARTLKDFISQAVDAWNALDSDTSRENLNKIVGYAKDFLGFIQSLAPLVEAIGKHFKDLEPLFQWFIDTALPGMLVGLEALLTPVKTLLNFLEYIGLITLPEDKLKSQISRIADNLNSSLGNTVVNVGIGGPSAEEARAAGNQAAVWMGDGFGRAAETILAMKWTNTVNTTGEAARRQAQSDMQGWGDLGVYAAMIYAASIRETGEKEVPRAFTDIQRRMLESAGIDPEMFVRALNAKEGLDRWTSMLVEDMAAGAKQGTDTFGNGFVSGMGGWASTATAQMHMNGLNIAGALRGALDQEEPSIVGAAARLAVGVKYAWSPEAMMGDNAFRLSMGIRQIALEFDWANSNITLDAAAGRIASGIQHIAWGFMSLGGVVKTEGEVMQDNAFAAAAGVATAFDIGLTPLTQKIATRMGEGLVQLTSGMSGWVATTQSETNRLAGVADKGLELMVGNVARRMATGVETMASQARAMTDNATTNLSPLPGRTNPILDAMLAGLTARMSTGAATMGAKAQEMVSNARSNIARLPSEASAALAPLAGSIGSRMSAAAATASSSAATIVRNGANIGGMVGAAASAIAGLAGAIGAKMSAAFATASYWAGKIKAVMAGAKAANTGFSLGLPMTASGGIFAGAQARIIGEAGPEAVVPLNRNLSQVDPSVRALSAIAQGMVPSGVGGLHVESGAIRVTTNVANPELVAESVLDHLFASAQG